MKTFISFFLIGVLALLSLGAFAQVPPASQVIPTATKIYSVSVNSMIVFLDSTAKKGTAVKKGTTRLSFTKTGIGARTTVIENSTGKVIWDAVAGKAKVTGVTSTTATRDSLNRKWLEENLE